MCERVKHVLIWPFHTQQTKKPQLWQVATGVIEDSVHVSALATKHFYLHIVLPAILSHPQPQ